MRSSIKNLEGYCLVSLASSSSDEFFRSVILITHHHAGALGVILNRPTGKFLKDYSPTLRAELGRCGVYNSGPVEKDLLSLLAFTRTSHSLSVQTHLTPAAARKLLKEKNDKNVSTEVRAYFGYAGWAKGQLESEIKRGHWKVLPLTPLFTATDDAPESSDK